ncbi:MAG: hypothetical protein LBD21_11130 [Tannerellaceae bacterium]|nr:hypothetical protein [Tannerellaceae bacterium]
MINNRQQSVLPREVAAHFFWCAEPPQQAAGLSAMPEKLSTIGGTKKKVSLYLQKLKKHKIQQDENISQNTYKSTETSHRSPGDDDRGLKASKGCYLNKKHKLFFTHKLHRMTYENNKNHGL